MDERHLSRVQAALAAAADPKTLLKLGRESGFCERLRSVSPQQLVAARLSPGSPPRCDRLRRIYRSFRRGENRSNLDDRLPNFPSPSMPKP